MSDVGGIAADKLRSLIHRIERLEEEIKVLNGDKSDIYKEAKALGFDVKAMRALVAERRKEPHELAEMGAMLDLYRAAMDSAAALGTPCATRAPAHDPETGEVVDRKVADVAMKIAHLAGANPGAAAAVLDAIDAKLAGEEVDLTIPASLRRTA